MSRRNGVLVVQLDAQAVSRTTNKREVRRAEHERENVGFQAASVNQSVEEMRERCNTKTENTARTEACVTRIEEVGDVEHEKPEHEEEGEFGERKTTRKHDHRQPCE